MGNHMKGSSMRVKSKVMEYTYIKMEAFTKETL